MSQLVLLDTVIAAGVLSRIRKDGNEEKSRLWIECVKNLINEIESPSVSIPTPVFYELASWNDDWFSVMYDQSTRQNRSKIFEYINHSITPNILFGASRYKNHKCGDADDEKHKKSKKHWMDSLIAGYCLTHGYHLITMNQNDFPQRFFDVVDIGLAPLMTKKDERRVVFLLSPKLDKWQEYLTKTDSSVA